MPSPRRPLILVAASPAPAGIEFGDPSLSLSCRYTDALLKAGALPWVFPPTQDPDAVREALSRCDGVLLTGGDDIGAGVHRPDASREMVARCIGVDPARDLSELLLLRELFAQPKPLLAICRGLQILNVALGGDLFIDLPTERPGPVAHNQLDRKDQPVHPVALDPASLLAQAVGRRFLNVNSTHHQAVNRLAPALRPVAAAPDGLVEAAELNGDGILPWCIAVQFHPERLAPKHPSHRRILTAFVNACRIPL